ncbi:MAG: cysteine dioxygenase family protein [Planctomycetota bacterium]
MSAHTATSPVPSTPPAPAEDDCVLRAGPAWRRLFDELDRAGGPANLDRRLFAALMAAVPSHEPWIEAAAAFSERGYQRNRIMTGDGYEALLMCWRPGQESPVHDHAGSLCGVRVLRGTCVEVRYERDIEGNCREIGTSRYRAGSVCVSFDADTHKIANDAAGGCDLVTLHVYTPPLVSMKTYPALDPLARYRIARSGGLMWGDGI